jgi:hypothetical protein
MLNHNQTKEGKMIKIKIGIIGYLPFHFNKELIKRWKSNEFKIIDDIQEQQSMRNADIDPKESNVSSGKKGHSWRYSDSLLEKETDDVERNSDKADFSIWVTFVPLKDNYFVRRLNSNRVILSYFEMYDILKRELIPVENLLLRTIYRHILIYLKYKRTIPSHESILKIPFIHDDTRGCLFDMCVNKADVVFFLNKPNICKDCTGITNEVYANTIKVGEHHINQIKKECEKKIKRGNYYKIVAFVKENPGWSFLLSIAFGLLLNLSATLIYDAFKKNDTTVVNCQQINTTPNRGEQNE